MRQARRLSAFAAGCVLAALGVAGTILADLGAAPYDAMNVGLRARIGVGPGTAMWPTATLVVAATWVLGTGPRAGKLVAFLTIGQIVNLTLDFAPSPTGVPARVALLAAAVAALWAGLCLAIAAEFGAGFVEALMLAMAGRGMSLRAARSALEVMFAAAAARLGGPVSIVTAVMAVATGRRCPSCCHMPDGSSAPEGRKPRPVRAEARRAAARPRRARTIARPLYAQP